MLEIWELGGMRSHSPEGGKNDVPKNSQLGKPRGTCKNMIGKQGVTGQEKQAYLCHEPGTVLTTCLVSWFQVLSNLTPQPFEGDSIILK